MKIILEDEEAEEYILNRHISNLKSAERELKNLHDRFRDGYDDFEVTDLCNKIEQILNSIATNKLIGFNNNALR